MNTEQKCPFPDCPRVHYLDCPVHGSATHEHHFKGCTWQPNSHTGQKGWREELRNLTLYRKDSLGFRKTFSVDEIESLIERTLQEQREELVKKIRTCAESKPAKFWHLETTKGYAYAIQDFLSLIKDTKPL